MAKVIDMKATDQPFSDALGVLKRLRTAGHVAYFAGGCVRDMLLGQTPKDYDVATSARPDEVRRLFHNSQAVGAAFGVILVRAGATQVEVATFRADGNYSDGRRPDQVRFTSAEEDARRRDFTINGMFFDPIAQQTIDYVGGQADLQKKVLRAIGEPEKRFNEDHLRMLRAVRFASRFGLEIEPCTQAAVQALASRIVGISPERIADELRRMLAPDSRATAWPLLWNLGLGAPIFRFLSPQPPALLPPESILLEIYTDVPVRLGLALSAAALDVRLASQPARELGHWLEKPQAHQATQALRKSLKISNDERDELAGALEGAAFILRTGNPTVAQLKRFLAQPWAGAAQQLCMAISNRRICKKLIDQRLVDLIDLEGTDFNPLPFVTGDDLTATGLQPGPKFKRVLDTVYDLQLEGKLKDKCHALQQALEIWHSDNS